MPKPFPSTPQFSDAMTRALSAGVFDQSAGLPQQTGRQLARAFLAGTGWTIGHSRHLRAAYAAGRFHASLKG